MTIFQKICLAAVIAGTLSGTVLFAQALSSDAPKLAFEVASIKPNKTDGVGDGARIGADE